MNAPMQDIVAQLPDVLVRYKKEHGTLPLDAKIEEKFSCIWQNKYYIHTRVTLPLLAIDQGIGFGLWVELSQADFEKYLAVVDDDAQYKDFQAQGKLANEWPGFEETLGISVKVRPIRLDEKIYITEVLSDHTLDPILQVALLAQKDDTKIIENVRKVVMAWMESFS